MQGCLVEVACARHGSRCLENVWRHLTLEQRTQAAEELTSSQRLSSDRFGHFLVCNLSLVLFQHDRKCWLEAQGSQLKRRRKMAVLVKDAGEASHGITVFVSVMSDVGVCWLYDLFMYGHLLCALEAYVPKVGRYCLAVWPDCRRDTVPELMVQIFGEVTFLCATEHPLSACLSVLHTCFVLTVTTIISTVISQQADGDQIYINPVAVLCSPSSSTGTKGGLFGGMVFYRERALVCRERALVYRECALVYRECALVYRESALAYRHPLL